MIYHVLNGDIRRVPFENRYKAVVDSSESALNISYLLIKKSDVITRSNAFGVHISCLCTASTPYWGNNRPLIAGHLDQ